MKGVSSYKYSSNDNDSNKDENAEVVGEREKNYVNGHGFRKRVRRKKENLS